MRHLASSLALTLTLVTAALAPAQLAGGGTTTGGSTGSTSGAGATTQQPQLATITGAPVIAPPSETQTTTGTLDPSNFLAPTYANPYYQGRAGATLTDVPGGFGSPLYGSTGGTAGRTGLGGTKGATTGGGGATGGSSLSNGATATGGGTTGIRGPTGIGGTTGIRGSTGIGGTTGGQLGRTTVGSRGGLGTGSGSGTGGFTGGVIVPLVRPIAYRAVLKFRAPPPASPAAMQSELQRMIVGSSFVPSASTVRVTTVGSEVVLRGYVADEDEARTIEGMVRLTPGVGAIRNELVVR